ncbi:MAG: NUDIX hydrolase [Candidatus Uhrbacteria bacterium]|nr:NUDIX hydrolase [Candidatus Uhrbacteria bacterium]
MKQIQWKKLRSRVAYKNKWVTVLEDDIRMPDGSQDVYTYIDSKAGVLIAAVDDQRRLLLVHHYRYPTNRHGWEFPGGGVDPKKALAGAKRELLEETGFTARTWKKIGAMNSWAFRANELMIVYRAQSVSKKTEAVDDGEGISAMQWFALSEIADMITIGTIRDAQTIAAFFFVQQYFDML